MGRVNPETIKKLTDFINSLPEDARDKCSICNKTLVHIVKQAEAQTGAGTATVTRVLADKINEKSLPQDIVEPEALRKKVTREENVSIRTERPNKPEPEKQKEVKVNQYSNAVSFATIAISQLERIKNDDPKKNEALNRVTIWINNKLQE